jgi:hypothetical protein
MTVKFKQNIDVRLIDFNFPKEAISAVYAVKMDYIERDVWTQGMVAGPMPLKFPHVSGERSRICMMIEAEHADSFIKDIRKAVRKAVKEAAVA